MIFLCEWIDTVSPSDLAVTTAVSLFVSSPLSSSGVSAIGLSTAAGRADGSSESLGSGVGVDSGGVGDGPSESTPSGVGTGADFAVAVEFWDSSGSDIGESSSSCGSELCMGYDAVDGVEGQGTDICS